MTRGEEQKQRALTAAQYQRLRKELTRILARGRERLDEAVGRALVLTYHAIGQRLVDEQLSSRAGYASFIIQRLADDIDLNVRVLQQAIVFASAYPDGPPQTGLTWSHYRQLLALGDPVQRDWYEQQASRRAWPVRKLGAAIREQRHWSALPPPKGKSKRRRRTLRRPDEAIYVYAADVERVVDGDTLIVDVDLGFEVSKRQRLRLAGLDTPALETAAGAKARDFVQHELARVERVMIKTDKIDLYGRYVAHVFYEPGERSRARIFAEGSYLNQRLVDEGLAEAL